MLQHAGFDSGYELTKDIEDEDIPLALLFQELCEWGYLETLNDENNYK